MHPCDAGRQFRHTACWSSFRVALARALHVCVAALGGPRVVTGVGGVFDGLARGMHVAMAGVLNQLLLGLLEALGLALPGLNQRPLGLARATIAGLRFATRLSAGDHEFTYVARATTSGTFRTAPSHAEEMYEPEVFGRTATTAVTVRP